MNIYWEEHDSADERPKHWSEEGVEGTVIAAIEAPPQPVGGYDITGNVGGPGSYMFMFLKKPNWFHRACSRFFLGWKWFDGDGLNRKVKK
jgi:hypothetical protein